MTDDKVFVITEHVPVPKTPEQMWEDFIAHLHVVRPVKFGNTYWPHVSFLGAIEGYKKIFLEANDKTLDA